MIQIENCGKTVRITGSADQIALEFEIIAREVENAFCKGLGEEAGNEFYRTILHYAEMDQDERDRHTEAEINRVKEEMPELFRELEEHIEKILAKTAESMQVEVHTEK